MSEKQTGTDRRSFLKSGALVAAPLAAMAPVAALADDGSRAKLARIEDERAIEALHRDFLRRVNRGERGAVKLAEGLAGLADNSAADAQIAFSDDGRRARARRACKASFRTDFTGNSTLEQMARLQGQGSHAHEEPRVLVADYVKGRQGWAIERLRLA
jgi:hypothetical protein